MKKITLSSPGRSLPKGWVMKAKKALGIAIPKPMREFYSEANGGVPDECYFYGRNEFEPIWLKLFISFEDSEVARRNVVETFKFLSGKGFFTEPCIPFAVDHGGNFFLQDQNGAIQYMTADGSSRNVSESFEDFVNSLSDEE